MAFPSHHVYNQANSATTVLMRASPGNLLLASFANVLNRAELDVGTNDGARNCGRRKLASSSFRK